VLLVAAAVAGCSNKSHSSAAAPPTTTAAGPSTTAAAAGGTSLIVSGFGPGVMETPFYPSTTITSVQCGVVPGGVFVEVHIPGDPSDPYPHSVMTLPTTAVIVNGEASVKDSTGKTVYEQTGTGNLSGRTGTVVLSMNLLSYVSGNGLEVVDGAVNINGNYACPAANIPYPGL
jgi:hypothetical protein